MSFPISSIPGFAIHPVPPTIDGFRVISRIEHEAVRGMQHPIAPLLWPKENHSNQGSSNESSVEKKDESPTADSTNHSGDKKDDDDGEDPISEDETFHHFASFLKDPENHYFMVREDDTGKAVAFVWWQFTKGKSVEEWARFYENRFRPKEINAPLADATGGVRVLKRAKILGDRDFFSLKELFVLPSHQRRGLGGSLVEWGVKKADELGLVAYTEATPEGLNLYFKHGFREVGRVTVDLKPWGGKEGEFDTYGLLLRDGNDCAGL